MPKTAPDAPPPARPLPALALLGLGAAAVWAATEALSPYMLTLLAMLCITAALAVSLTLANGLTGLFSLGHPAFMTIGAYAAGVLTFPAARKGTMLTGLPDWLAALQLPLAPALLAAAALGGAVALAVGWPVLRLRGHYLAVATLGLIIIVQNLSTNWVGVTRGGMGMSGLPRLTGPWWAFGALAATLALAWRIKFSSLGRAMLAMRENELAAECAGIDTTRLRLLAFVTGAVVAAVCGALMAHLVSVVTPRSYSVALAFNLVVMVVIGGQGSIAGALVAAAAITALSESLRPVEEGLGLYGLSQMTVALALVAALLLRPKGLFGSGEPGWLLRFLNGRETT